MEKQVDLDPDVKYTHSELDSLPDETDWERVNTLTAEEIDAASSTDSNDPPIDESFWIDATADMPEHTVIVNPDLLA